MIFSYPSVLTYILGVPWDGSFEYLQEMFWLKNKKVNYILLFRALLQMCNIESSTVKPV